MHRLLNRTHDFERFCQHFALPVAINIVSPDLSVPLGNMKTPLQHITHPEIYRPHLQNITPPDIFGRGTQVNAERSSDERDCRCYTCPTRNSSPTVITWFRAYTKFVNESDDFSQSGTSSTHASPILVQYHPIHVDEQLYIIPSSAMLRSRKTASHKVNGIVASVRVQQHKRNTRRPQTSLCDAAVTRHHEHRITIRGQNHCSHGRTGVCLTAVLPM